MSAKVNWRAEGLLGVSDGDGVEEIGRDRGGAASARESGLEEEKQLVVVVVVVVGGMEINSLELRLVWVVVGERGMVSLELRVLLLVGVRGVSSFESSVVEVDVVSVVASVLSAGFW